MHAFSLLLAGAIISFAVADTVKYCDCLSRNHDSIISKYKEVVQNPEVRLSSKYAMQINIVLNFYERIVDDWNCCQSVSSAQTCPYQGGLSRHDLGRFI